MPIFLCIKSLHIIFVITWFAGLFYFPRLLIYATETKDQQDEKIKTALLTQFQLMQKRLWLGIAWPSAVLTFIFGFWTLYLYGMIDTWLIMKLALVFLLYLYHISLHIIYRQQQRSVFKYSSQHLRYWNEVPTILLFGIIFLVVGKNSMNLFTGLMILFVLMMLIILGIRIYKIKRQRTDS